MFNKILRIGVLLGVLLITIGGIIFLSHHFRENYYTAIILPQTYAYTFWISVIDIGIFLLILLQIARIIYYARAFWIKKERISTLNAAFISLVLIFSLLYSSAATFFS